MSSESDVTWFQEDEADEPSENKTGHSRSIENDKDLHDAFKLCENVYCRRNFTGGHHNYHLMFVGDESNNWYKMDNYYRG